MDKELPPSRHARAGARTSTAEPETEADDARTSGSARPGRRDSRLANLPLIRRFASPADPWGILSASLAIVVVAGLILAIVEWSSASSRLSSDQSLRRSAIQAANTYGVYLSSYDYTDLNGPTAPWTLVDQHATPTFRKDFDATKASLTTLINTYKAKATGKVVATGLESVSSSSAAVLLFVDQTVTNTAQKPGTSTQPLRVIVVLSRSSGKWLIDRLQVPL